MGLQWRSTVFFCAEDLHKRVMSDATSHEQAADRAAASGDPSSAVRSLEMALVEQPRSLGLWAKLAAMKRATGDLPGALGAIDQALSLDPLDFSALLARAFMLDQARDPRAGEAFGNAVAQQPSEDEIPPAMRDVLGRAQLKSDAHRAEVEARMLAVTGGGSPSPGVTRFISNASRRTRHFHQEPSHFHFPGLPEIEFHDRDLFPELAGLEAQGSAIRDEFSALVAAEATEIAPYIQYSERVPLRQWQALNQSRDWSAIHLMKNGRRIDANARHCPITMAAITKFQQPAIDGASPNAMFSLLAPRTRIPAHTGVANTRLVCHLPLIVPTHCGFRVGASTREWRPDEAFVFDDTIEHEAWNDSDELRVVLIFDVWPPALSAADRTTVAAIIPVAGVGFSGL